MATGNVRYTTLQKDGVYLDKNYTLNIDFPYRAEFPYLYQGDYCQASFATNDNNIIPVVNGLFKEKAVFIINQRDNEGGIVP